ncbi:MAG: TetR/AcrR family transcriptional regulator [Rhodospirillales bacterium]
MTAQAVAETHERKDKSGAIIDAATRVFLECGYGNASMDAIAAEAGVAKQTLYSHFGSKAQLFEAIVIDRCTELLGLADAAGRERETEDTPEVSLHRAGQRFLRVILDTGSIGHYRAVVSESARFPELAEAFYRAGPLRAVACLGSELQAFDTRGLLRVDDPEASAHLFYAMLRGDLHMRCVLGLCDKPDPSEIDTWVSRVVAAFVAIHRP